MSLSKQCFLLLPLLITGLTGCSSVDTWSSSSLPPSPYAATRSVGSDIVETSQINSGLEEWDKLLLPFMAVDFVGSAAADTLVLPITLIGQANRGSRGESY